MLVPCCWISSTMISNIQEVAGVFASIEALSDIDNYYGSQAAVILPKKELVMLKLRSVVLTSIFTAATAMSWAANPELVGTFSGSAKINTYNADGSKSKVTAQMQLEIAADDTTTFTLNGVVALPPLVAYNGPNGFIIHGSISGYQTLTFQVKKTSIKGVIQQIVGTSPETAVISDGKFKLKKSN
jgi:hypothetical protein